MELTSHSRTMGKPSPRRLRGSLLSSRSFYSSADSAGKRDSIGFCVRSAAPRQVNSPSWALMTRALFAAARVFVLTSYSENFGNTVLEAMRRGVPVVATPEVGAAEILRECGGGLVVAGDESLLGAAICRLTSDVSLARSMGEAGQRHATANYSWAAIAVRMEDFYKSLKVAQAA